MLNFDSPIPLYHQLADRILSKIRSGELSPGNRIPAETKLARQYGIGRPTVRQAMNLLLEKGVIERKRGSGTFVKKREQRVDLFSLAGTTAAFSKEKIEIRKEMVTHTVLRQTGHDHGNPFSEKKAYFLSRLTSAQGSPVLLEEMFLDHELFFGFENCNLKNRSLARVILEQYHLKPVKGRQTFQVSTLEPQKAGLLDLDSRFPVLEVKRTLDFPNAENAFFAKLFCRTDRFGFSQEIYQDYSDKGDR